MRPPTVESVGSRGLIFRLLIVAILAPLSGCYSLRSMPAGVGFAAPIGGGAKPFFDPPGSVFRHNPDGLETGRGHAPVAGIDGYRVEAPKAKGGHTWQTTGKKSQKNIYIGGAIGGIVGGVLGASHCSKYDDGSSSGGFPDLSGLVVTAPEVCALGGGIAGALLGAGIGAILSKNP